MPRHFQAITITLASFLFGLCAPVTADVFLSPSDGSVTATSVGIAPDGVDEIVFTTKTSLELTYRCASPAKITWQSYSTGSDKTDAASAANATSLSVNAVPSRGYIVTARDNSDNVIESKTLYIVQMADKMFRPISLDTVTNDDHCTYAKLRAVYNNPTVGYVTSSGASKSIKREFTISYNTVEYNGTDISIVERVDTFMTKANGNGVEDTINVDAPYANTFFKLSGDLICDALSLTTPVSTPYEYESHIVTAKIAAKIIEREGLNEAQRSDSSATTGIGGSAPLQVAFTSNSNYPVAQFFQWIIIDNDNKKDSSNVYHDRDLNYTFTRTGVYTVILKAEHNYDASTSSACQYDCEPYIDSILVTVSESMLEVPSAFTPNGDGVNDEFRVSFKSLSKFNCQVFNRWGTKVYEWSDPTTGWDGTVNGSKASVGPYYYIIEATGTDRNSDGSYKTYRRKGNINLFR